MSVSDGSVVSGSLARCGPMSPTGREGYHSQEKTRIGPLQFFCPKRGLVGIRVGEGLSHINQE